jgi:subfamily B ATP-binding cassette protein MsbA
MQDRTVFVIAHRMSTVRRATRIVVIEDGRITEIGTHEELMQKSGTYRRLYDLQFDTAELEARAAVESAEAEVLEGTQ